jgi:N utilization substance protein B
MATRRQAREWAVQILYRLDLNPGELPPAFESFWADPGVESDPTSRAFAEDLVRGVRAHAKEIDDTIKRCAENWELHRMAAVDRNVLRMAVHELLHCPGIPPVVAINEAVDIAKYFNSSESGRFVNGVLDRIRKDLNRPSRSPA